MNGLDILGAEYVALPTPHLSWGRTAIALAAGAVGAVLVRRHPVLAFLGTAAAASNVHAVATGDRTWPAAVKRMGKHVVATVGSLSVPKYPVLGYIAGAVAGDLLIDGEGGGIIEEFADYQGIRSVARPSKDVIDAEWVEQKPNTTKALVQR